MQPLYNQLYRVTPFNMHRFEPRAWDRQIGQTDGRIAVLLNVPYGQGTIPDKEHIATVKPTL